MCLHPRAPARVWLCLLPRLQEEEQKARTLGTSSSGSTETHYFVSGEGIVGF